MKKNRLLMVNVVKDAVASLGKEYRVDKTVGIRTIRIYFNSRFCTECLLRILMNIPGLYVVGVNCDERFILATY